jgi:hypothetical protein
VDFALPPEEFCDAWEVVLNTADGRDPQPHPAGSTLEVPARSVLVLREWREAEPEAEWSPAASVQRALGTAEAGA